MCLDVTFMQSPLDKTNKEHAHVIFVYTSHRESERHIKQSDDLPLLHISTIDTSRFTTSDLRCQTSSQRSSVKHS
ncbi:CLUMA_CG002978, isoform A [Clunio marinus]|uniref:CLUMA_CG002978, isoform A n=1 Tax=Clunio marinus TaxID=568069 RepID=A0A1J1HMQ1_9DIPT|nr:CLUMA_CG002978, isoform A [Clunio marinus]